MGTWLFIVENNNNIIGEDFQATLDEADQANTEGNYLIIGS